jgi:RNA recognition motif-containing protein
MNIYVGNLPFNMTEERLKELFSGYGTVESAKVIKDRFTGHAKGFGFIEMPDNSEADKAIKALNNNRLGDECIKVRPADPGGKRKKNTRRRQSY